GERGRQFAHDRSAADAGEFHVLALVLRLRLLARGNVDHRCQHKQTLRGADRIEAHFDGKFAAVFPPAKKIAASSHGTAARLGMEAFTITAMSIAETFRNQRLDRKSTRLNSSH